MARVEVDEIHQHLGPTVFAPNALQPGREKYDGHFQVGRPDYLVPGASP